MCLYRVSKVVSNSWHLPSRRYLFDCCCEACSKDWPLHRHLPVQLRGLPRGAYLAGEGESDKAVSRLTSMLQNRKKRKAEAKGDGSGWQQDVVEDELRFHVDLVTLSGSVLRRPHALLVTSEDDLHEAIRRERLRHLRTRKDRVY